MTMQQSSATIDGPFLRDDWREYLAVMAARIYLAEIEREFPRDSTESKDGE